MTKVILSASEYDDRDFLSLTDDQLRLLQWLKDEDYLPYDTIIETVETTDFKEI